MKKQIVIDGKTYDVKVIAPRGELLTRVKSARHSGNFEMEAEARAEARHEGIDLGVGYSA